MPLFKIVRIFKGGGYRYCRTEPPHPRRTAKGVYPLHRVRMKNKLGRLLRRNEIVHHRDENRANDRTSNLEVMTRADHARHHAYVPPVKIKCGFCKSPMIISRFDLRTRKRRNKMGRAFCSRSCGSLYQQRKIRLTK